MRTIIILIIICSSLSCSTSRSLTLYVTNIKETEKSVDLKVYVDDSLCVNDNFRYSSITPNYDVYVYKFGRGVHTLKILKNDNQMLIDTINLKENMFIYITYGEGAQGEGMMFIKKTTTDYKLH